MSPRGGHTKSAVSLHHTGEVWHVESQANYMCEASAVSFRILPHSCFIAAKRDQHVYIVHIHAVACTILIEYVLLNAVSGAVNCQPALSVTLE